MRVHGVHMGAWGCTLPSTAAASRTHRSPGRKKIRPLTGTPRMLSWRWEVAMILVYRLAENWCTVGTMDLYITIAGMACPKGLDVGAGASAQ